MDESLEFPPDHLDPSFTSIPLLSSASTWTPQQIEDRLQDLLQVTSGILISSDRPPDDKLLSMSWISEKLLPLIPIFELDESAYCPLLTAVLELLDQVFSVLPEKDQLEEKVALLTTAVTLIDHATAVVKHAREQEGAGPGELPSVPRLVPKILYNTFSHCGREREALVDMDHQVKDGLDTLFIKSKDALENFCGLMESMKIRSVLEDEMEILMDLCSSLVEFHGVLINANFKIACRCWQLFARLTDQHAERLKDKLDLHRAVEVLGAQLNQSLKSLLEEPESLPGQTPSEKAKSANKQAAISAFMAKLLAKLSQNYSGCIREELDEYFLLLLRLLTTDYSTPEWFSSELINKIERDIFSPLIFSSIFRLSTAQTSSKLLSTFWEKGKIYKIGSSRPFPTILLILKILEEMRSKELELPSNNDKNLLHLLFVLMKFSSKDLSKAPSRDGIPVMGNPVVKVDNYEFILTNLCAWISTASPSEFLLIERCLFTQILHASGFTALLTCDTWCFIARYGTSQTCHSHITLLTKLLLKHPLHSFASSSFWIQLLISRLFNFLAPEEQKQWMEEFSPVEPHNLRLFSLINLNSMKGEASSTTLHLLHDIVHSHLEEFLSGSWSSPSHPILSGHCLSIATDLHKAGGLGSDWLPEAVFLIWRKLAEGSFAASTLYWESHFFSNLAEATLAVVGTRVSSRIPLLIGNLKTVVKAGVSAPYLLVALAKILPRLACEGGPQLEQEALTEIAGLYRTLLSQSAREAHVHVEALAAFSAFAHSTNHEGVLGLCVESGVNESVKGFIAKKIEACEEEVEGVSDVNNICDDYKDELKEAVLKECVENDEPRRKVSPGVRPPRIGSPSSKKRKFGNGKEEWKSKIETIIKNLGDETSELLRIVEEDKENKLEGDSEKQIATIISQLQTLVSSQSYPKEDKGFVFSQSP